MGSKPIADGAGYIRTQILKSVKLDNPRTLQKFFSEGMSEPEKSSGVLSGLVGNPHAAEIFEKAPNKVFSLVRKNLSFNKFNARGSELLTQVVSKLSPEKRSQLLDLVKVDFAEVRVALPEKESKLFESKMNDLVPKVAPEISSSCYSGFTKMLSKLFKRT